MWYDILIIVGLSLALSVGTEAALWYFVYRTEKYQKAAEELEHVFARYERVRADDKTPSKRRLAEVERLQLADKLVRLNKALGASKGFLPMLLPLVFLAVTPVLSPLFQDRALARLPFVPTWGFVSGWTHRGVAGEDMQEIGFSFVYMLCAMGLRQAFARLIQKTPPKGAGVGGVGESAFSNLFAEATKRAEAINKKEW